MERVLQARIIFCAVAMLLRAVAGQFRMYVCNGHIVESEQVGWIMEWEGMG